MAEDRVFRRDFDVAKITTHLQRENSIVRELFDRWVLPGQDSHNGRKPLRLALRDGYINLYADGQSVACLSVQKSGLRMSVAEAYVPPFLSTTSTARKISRFEGDQLQVSNPSVAIDEIVKLAIEHPTRSAEKCFVEHLIAANANIIEVEMALPGETGLASVRRKWRDKDAKKIAPRMDIVAVHILPDGKPQIDFWEAKLANNGELRATLPEKGGKEEPNVREQLLDYETWMRLPHRHDQVVDAFRCAGRALDALAAAAGKDGLAREYWRKLSAAAPLINPRPGIVIGNYHPTADTYGRIGSSDSFAMHKARLMGSHLDFPAIEVIEVDGRDHDNRLFNQPMPIAQT